MAPRPSQPSPRQPLPRALAALGATEHPLWPRAAVVAVLAGLVVFHAINNWIWLKANVTILGWDVPGHLGTSLVYNGILDPLTPKSLFEAVVWHPNRPPLVYLSTVPLYRAFGATVDIGTMVNVLYLAMLFGAVYGIGRHLGGRRVGLLAAVTVALLPGIYATSRFFYHELALAALVSLSVFLLLETNGFTKRTASLLFGLSFGLGLLTTRTYLTFIFAPLVLVILRSDTLPTLLRRLRGGFRLSPRDVLLSLGLGLVLAALWYLPGREIAAGLLLRRWLLPLWAALLAATIYLLRRTPDAGTNLVSALALGGTLASVWYLPRITFVQNLLSFGFGVNDPRERSAGLDQLSTYLYFPLKLVNEHLSPVTSLVLLAAVAALVLYVARRRGWWSALRHADRAWWATALWIAGSYLVMTLSIYRKSRGIVPMLPALALLLAAGLFKLPWRRAATLLAGLLVGWGLLQFFVLSYPGPHRLAEQTQFRWPVLGDSGLFAQGGTVLLPASGETDPDYWVEPELLRRVEAGRQADGLQIASLGVVANSAHLNALLFSLVASQEYPGIQVRDLAGLGPDDVISSMLFEQDYLVWSRADRSGLDSALSQALDRMTAGGGFFGAAYTLDSELSVPGGDSVLLYRKVQRMEAPYDAADYAAVAGRIVSGASPADAILLVPPAQVEALGRTYAGSLAPYLLPREVPLDRPETERTLRDLVDRHPVVWAVFRQEDGVDPDHFIEAWLNSNAYRAHSEWSHGLRLVVYGAPGPEPADRPQQSLEASLGGQVRLLGYSLVETTLRPGSVVRLALYWQADDAAATERLTVFAHLVDDQGRLVAQQDSEPVGGSRPTTSWAAGEVIRDPIGILLPPDLPEGEYRLAVGLYRPGTGERLPVSGPGAGVGMDDHIYLGEKLCVEQP
ncbi:MAG TPA: glycosyltransferase family 39 protein [Anaerolineae bacterium]|nr:glycosyltransferase family 39 protein [Anaerolineae bacterium]